MKQQTYQIEKTRTGRLGAWNSWTYDTQISDEQAKEHNISDTERRALTGRSLDELAEKMARVNGIENALLLASNAHGTRAVSLVISGDTPVLTQYGLISDEELGELGSLVQRYAMRKQSES